MQTLTRQEACLLLVWLTENPIPAHVIREVSVGVTPSSSEQVHHMNMEEAVTMMITTMMENAGFMYCHAECVVNVVDWFPSEAHSPICLVIVLKGVLNFCRKPQICFATLTITTSDVVSHISCMATAYDAAISQHLGDGGWLFCGQKLIIVQRVYIDIHSPVRQHGVIILKSLGSGYLPHIICEQKTKCLLKLNLNVPAYQTQQPKANECLYFSVVSKVGQVWLDLVVNSANQAQFAVMVDVSDQDLCLQLQLCSDALLCICVCEDCE